MLQSIAVRLLVILGAVLSSAGGGFFYGQHVAGLAATAREDAAQRAGAAAIAVATENRFEAERSFEQRFATADQTYQQQIGARDHALNKALADLDIAHHGLQFAGACTNGSGAVSQTATGPGISDGGTTVELSVTASRWAEQLANEADAVADQLRACQVILVTERQ